MRIKELAYQVAWDFTHNLFSKMSKDVMSVNSSIPTESCVDVDIDEGSASGKGSLLLQLTDQANVACTQISEVTFQSIISPLSTSQGSTSNYLMMIVII